MEQIYFLEQKNSFVEIWEIDIKHLMTEINCENTENIDEQEKLLLILGQLKPKHIELIELSFF